MVPLYFPIPSKPVDKAVYQPLPVASLGKTALINRIINYKFTIHHPLRHSTPRKLSKGVVSSALFLFRKRKIRCTTNTVAL
jgi:hypothetical protein